MQTSSQCQNAAKQIRATAFPKPLLETKNTPEQWDSNPRMLLPKNNALPLGYAPDYFAYGGAKQELTYKSTSLPTL